jgi:hypothetical protein
MLFLYKLIPISNNKMDESERQLLENQVLENGLLIEDIPDELRSEKVCINALKWALKKYQPTNEFKVREAMCFRIMSSFPNRVLLYGFVVGHLSHFA